MYEKNLASLKKLHESGKTKERSLQSLRARAREGFLFFEESQHRVRLFDVQTSTILVNSVRELKQRGITWRDLSNAKDNARITKDIIIEQLNKGQSEEEIVNTIKDKIRRYI